MFSHNLIRVSGVIAFMTAMMPGPEISTASAANAKQGEYIFRIAGCRGCHTTEADRKKNVFLAGGRALKTPFGTYYSPNISPDPDHGIGKWSERDFRQALRRGKNPDGDHYFPVFPYGSYTRMTDQDISDLWAYMKTVPPVARPNKPHDAGFIFGSRIIMGPWKLMNFTSGAFTPESSKPDQWNRGRYLVDALGHCAECHSPRNISGGLKTDMYLAGTPEGPDGKPVPNITPDAKTGIGKWDSSDIDSLLSMGMLPDGDFVGGSMGEAVDNTEFLTPNDRKAIAEYLKSIPAINHKVQKSKSDK